MNQDERKIISDGMSGIYQEITDISDKQYGQEKFSLKFLDPKLEKAFSREYVKYIQEQSFLSMCQIITIVVVCALFKTYACVKIGCHTLKWSYLVKGVLIIFVVIHYFLTKRNKKYALHFSSILTVVYMIDAMEELQQDKTSDELQVYAVIMTLLGCL